MMTIRSILALTGLILLANVAGAAPPSAEPVAIDIPALPLNDALKQLARQAGFQVVFYSKESEGVSTQGISGKLTAKEALNELLAGTALTYEFVNENTVAIRSIKTGAVAAQTNKVQLAAGEGAGSEAATASTEHSTGDKLEEVVVTAQKRKEILKDVPISISVMSGQSLDSSTFTGVMEALRTVPGVAVIANGGVGGGMLVNIRGVGNNAIFTGSSSVGYYLDGVPFSLIRDAIAPDQNSFDLERVEVLRGPQGTLYGASAQNGLVRVLTKNADLNQFELKARSTVSQTDGADGINYRGDVALNAPLVAGKLAARAVVGYESAAGWIDTPDKKGSNSNRTRTYRFKIDAQPTQQLLIGLSSWINRGNQDAGPFSDDNARRGFQNPPFSDPNVTTLQPEPLVEDYEVDNLQVTYEFPAFSLTSSSGYLDYRSTGTIDYSRYFIFDPAQTTSVVFSKIPERAISEEVILNSESGSAWKWTAGALYRDVVGGLYQSWLGVLPQPISWTDKSKSTAIFGQVGRRFGDDRFEWTLGARYFKDTNSEHENDDGIDPTTGIRYVVKKRYSATTPRAVLTWYPSKTAMMYASYAQGFRSGVPLGYNVGLLYPGLPGAKPDRLNNYEVGAKFDLLDRRLSFDVAAYYMKWNDIIGAFPVPFEGTLTSVLTNGKSASGPGVDFSMVARPADGLELGLSAGWNDLTQDEDVYLDLSKTQLSFAAGDRLGSSPELTSSAFVRLQRSLGAGGYRGALSISTSYTSRLQGRVDSQTVLSGNDMVFGQASLSVEAPSGWRAALFVDNFTNEHGIDFPSLAYYADDAETHPRPRTVGVQFEYHYGNR